VKSSPLAKITGSTNVIVPIAGIAFKGNAGLERFKKIRPQNSWTAQRLRLSKVPVL
jgi:hypothetical protein